MYSPSIKECMYDSVSCSGSTRSIFGR